MDSKITPLYYDYTPIELGEGKIYQSPMEYIAEDAQNQAMTAALYDNMINNQLPEFLANIPYLDKDKYDKLAGEYTTAIDDIARTLSENPYDKNAQRLIAELATRFRKDMSPQGELGLMAANKGGLDVWMQNNLPYATTDPETYEKMYEKKKEELLTNTDPYEIPNIISENIVPKPELYDKDKIGFAGEKMAVETNGFKDPAANDNTRIASIVSDYFNDDKYKPYLEQHNALEIPLYKDGVINDEHPFAEEAKNLEATLKAMRYETKPSRYTGNGGKSRGNRNSGSGSGNNSGGGNGIGFLFDESTENYIPNLSFSQMFESQRNIKRGDYNYEDVSNVQFLKQLYAKSGLTDNNVNGLNYVTKGHFTNYLDNTVDENGESISDKKKEKMLNKNVRDYIKDNLSRSTLRWIIQNKDKGESSHFNNGIGFTVISKKRSQQYTGDLTQYTYTLKLKDQFGLEYDATYTVDNQGEYKNHSVTPSYDVVKLFNGLKNNYAELNNKESQKVKTMSWERNELYQKNNKFLSSLVAFCNRSYRKNENDQLEPVADGVVLYNTDKRKSNQKIIDVALGQGDDYVLITYDSGFKIGFRAKVIDDFYNTIKEFKEPMIKYMKPQFLSFYSYINSMMSANNNAIINFDNEFNYLTGLGVSDDMRIKLENGYIVLQKKEGEEWKDMTPETGKDEEQNLSVYEAYTIYDMIK